MLNKWNVRKVEGQNWGIERGESAFNRDNLCVHLELRSKKADGADK